MNYDLDSINFLNMKKYLFTIICASLIIGVGLFGCSKDTRVSFSSVENLTGDNVKEIRFFSKGNVYLAVVDTFLIIQRNEEPNVQIYGTNSHKLLSEFGKVGYGPGEFQRPSLKKFTDVEPTTEAPILYLFDFRRQILSNFNVYDAVNGEVEIKQEKLSNRTYITSIHYVNDSLYVGSHASLNRFYINNYKSSRDTLIRFIPEPDFQIPENTLSAVYRSAVVVNHDRGILAAAPLFFGEINFFDLNGNYLQSTIWQRKDLYQEELTTGLRTFNKVKYQIVDIDSKGDLIFALNRNNSVIEYDQDELARNMKVQVFNWEGKPIKEYVLEGKYRLTNFAVDSINNRIYAYSPDQPDHTIIMFDMD